MRWSCKLKTARTKAVLAKFISHKLKINSVRVWFMLWSCKLKIALTKVVHAKFFLNSALIIVPLLVQFLSDIDKLGMVMIREVRFLIKKGSRSDFYGKDR